MATPKIFSYANTKNFNKRNTQAIGKGITAARGKVADLGYNIEDVLNRVAPEKVDELLYLLKKKSGKLAIKGKQVLRGAKATGSQLLKALKDLI